MSFLDSFRLSGRYAAAVAAAEAADLAGNPSPDLAASAVLPIVGPASPFHPDNHLQAVVWADLQGTGNLPATRAAAMQIPAVARHRHLICGVVARSPLVRMVVDAKTTTPAWATRTDGELSPYHRMLWTADDLIFTGWSVWRATRKGKDLETAERIAPERWEADVAGRIKVDGEFVAKDRLILIPGPHEGILTFGAPAIRRSIDNLNAAATAARNPSAYLELHYTGDDATMTDEQIDRIIARWAAARRGENGGVAWTNKWIEVREHGTHEAHLLIEGRNADAVDAARIMSNPASMADASGVNSTLTYETTEGRNAEFLDYGASFYMDAIAARLSMDDVVPEGERMAFDTAAERSIPTPTTGPTLED